MVIGMGSVWVCVFLWCLPVWNRGRAVGGWGFERGEGAYDVIRCEWRA